MTISSRTITLFTFWYYTITHYALCQYFFCIIFYFKNNPIKAITQLIICAISPIKFTCSFTNKPVFLFSLKLFSIFTTFHINTLAKIVTLLYNKRWYVPLLPIYICSTSTYRQVGVRHLLEHPFYV